MAALSLALRSQINIKTASSSVESLAKGIDKSQKSTNTISGTLSKRNKFKKSSLSEDKIIFVRRRDAVRRREEESIIEAGSLEGPSKRTRIPGGAAITESTKGLLGRIMDFVGTIFVGWLINYIPSIIKYGKTFVKRAQLVQRSLADFSLSLRDVMFDFNSLVGSVFEDLKSFDFLDQSGRVKTAFKELTDSIDDLQGSFLDSIALISSPLEPGEQEVPGAGPSGPSTSTEYYSQGGEKLTAYVGKKDYGDYQPGAIGTRGSRRVHGRAGQMGHTGEDYSLAKGTPLTMIAQGTVIDVGLVGDSNDPGGENAGYGNFVVFKLDTGEYVKLAHLDKVYVKEGDRVGAGSGPDGTSKVVARSGDSGLGPEHLHIDYALAYDKKSAWSSQTMDPKSFVDAGGIVIGKNVKGVQRTIQRPSRTGVPSAPGAPSASSSAGVWKPILDIIASAEAPGGYETRLGGGKIKGATGMTISEVARIAGDSGDGKNYAVGRYQFTTLRSQAKSAGLNPDRDLFSPENQDKIAIYLISRKKGITIEDIKKDPIRSGNILAEEWAGLPVLSNYARKRRGQSYYEGYGGNHATISADQYESVLRSYSQQSQSSSTRISAAPTSQNNQIAAAPQPATVTTVTNAAQKQIPGVTQNNEIAVVPQPTPVTNTATQKQVPIFTIPQNNQVAATSQPTISSPTPVAEIASIPKNMTATVGSVTPERTGPTIIVSPQQVSPPTQQQQPPLSSQYDQVARLNKGTMLNKLASSRFIGLELAYT